MAIELGDVAKDSITGFEGVVTSKTHWLHGCCRLGLQPTDLDNGKVRECQVFDENQLILVKAKNPPAPAVKTGGPRPAPSRHKDATR